MGRRWIMVGLGWHMVVNRTSGQRGANEQHYDGPTLDSDVGPTIRTPEDQRRPNVVLLSGKISRNRIIKFKTGLRPLGNHKYTVTVLIK